MPKQYVLPVTISTLLCLLVLAVLHARLTDDLLALAGAATIELWGVGVILSTVGPLMYRVVDDEDPSSTLEAIERIRAANEPFGRVVCFAGACAVGLWIGFVGTHAWLLAFGYVAYRLVAMALFDIRDIRYLLIQAVTVFICVGAGVAARILS